MPPKFTVESASFSLRVGTANIRSMCAKDDSGESAGCERRCSLAQLFDKEQILIVGIQESHSRVGGERRVGSYTMFCSAAALQGKRGGTEIWLHDKIMKKLGKPKTVFQDERTLVLVFAGQLLVASAHVLDTSYPPDEVAAWWKGFTSVVRKYAKDTPTIVLADANARIGSEETFVSGTVEREATNHNGQCLLSFARSCDLTLPSTWTPTGPTWRSSRGKWHRNDYVMLPRAWQSSVFRS